METQVLACACGKKYKWRDDLAGKRIRCKCGRTIEAPAAALAVAAPPPPPRAPVAVSGILSDGRIIRGPSAIERELREAAEHRDEALPQPSTLRDLVLPIALIVVGLVLSFIEIRFGPKPVAGSIARVMPLLLGRAALATGLMLGGVFLATQFLDICFVGSFRRSILKLCAIAIGPSAIYGLLSNSMGEPTGAIVGSMLSLAAYWLLFYFLMKLDVQDASICVIVTWILVTLANYLAYKAEEAASGAWI